MIWIIILFGIWMAWAVWDKYFKHKKKPKPTNYIDRTEAYLKRKKQ